MGVGDDSSFSSAGEGQQQRRQRKGEAEKEDEGESFRRSGGGKMEGWLYIIRSNRFRLHYSRKRYFILIHNRLDCFKNKPSSSSSSYSSDNNNNNNNKEDPIRSAVIDSCIRVTDNGRESIHRNVLFVFTLYNASNHNDQLKLGARSSEEAARWIKCLMETALKEFPNSMDNLASSSKKTWQPFRLSHGKGKSRLHSVDWTNLSPLQGDLMSSDVIAPSPWTIIGCENGLRLFKEAKDGDSHGKHWDDHPAIMAVGVVAADSEAVFRMIMSLGSSRSEWDFCFSQGRVVEHLDGHTDIIHKKLNTDWLPWGMKPRDLLLRRYWRREDDGTYVILYHSVFHQKCRPERSFVRACLKSGGYVIYPVNRGKQSVVKHMLAIDWKLWLSYIFPSSAKRITIRMLGRVAALRELFKAKLGKDQCSDFSSGELTRGIGLLLSRKEEVKVEVPSGVDTGSEVQDSQMSPSMHSVASRSIVQLSDAADEFYDFLDESEYDSLDAGWPSSDAVQPQDLRYTKMSTAAGLVKRLHDYAVQKRGYIDLQEASMEDVVPCNYGTTLLHDPTCSVPCSWANADPSTFLIRSETYLQDHRKIKCNGTLMQMVAADWLKSDKREDDLGGRPGGIVQKYAAQGGNEFFFIINIQVPGSTTYSLALYYMMNIPVEEVSLLHKFVKGDDAYRNARFKLIPYISKGSWIVKQSVGKKACLIGQALEINYFQGRNYIELGVDIGSSTVARGVVSLVLGYLNNLVIEMAFLIQGNTPEELPEFLLGTCRLNHLDASKSIPI